MKKIVYAIAALALIFTGCAKELDNSTTDNFSKVRLHVKVADQLTKVSADNDGRYHWQAGDKISVLNNAGKAFEFETEEGGNDVDFGGTISTGTLGSYAMYPACEDNESTGNDILFNIPNEITWVQDATIMPMLGKISGDKAIFKSVGGVLKLVCYNIPSGAEQFIFTATNKVISGPFLIDGSDDTPVLETEDGSGGSEQEIWINFKDNYNTNMVFYIPLPTGTIDGFSVSIIDGSANVLYSNDKTASRNLVVARNQMIIAPALDCTGVADAVLTNTEILAVITGSYTSKDISSTSGTWSYAYGMKQASKLQLKKQDDGGQLTLPSTFTSNISQIVLEGTGNGGGSAFSGTVYFKNTSTDETIASKTVSDISLGDSITIDVPSGNTTGYITADGVIRIASVIVKFVQTGTFPSLTATDDDLEIAVGSLTATTTVTLSNPVDALGVSCVVNDEAKSWLSASISGSTLTVTAAEANSTAADRDGTVTLKATGAANVVITVTQPTKMVANPSVTATAGDSKFTATWAAVPHATSYVAYLHTAPTATPATGGTNISASISESAGTYSITDYVVTNDTHYYLYVKVNEVESNYEAVSEYAVVDFTPAEAKGTEENPYTVSEALSIISGLPSMDGSRAKEYTGGIISSISKLESDNSITYCISADGTTSSELKIYKGKNIGNVAFTALTDLEVGDEVIIYGQLYNYGGTPEINSGNYITSRTRVHKVVVDPNANILMGGAANSIYTMTITTNYAWTAELNSDATSARGTKFAVLNSSDEVIASTISGTAGTTTIKFKALDDGNADGLTVSNYGTITFSDGTASSSAININQSPKVSVPDPEEITINALSIDGTNCSIVFAKISGTSPAVAGTGVRAYVNNTITISSEDFYIQKVDLTCKSNQGGSGSNKAYPTGFTGNYGSSFSPSFVFTGTSDTYTYTPNADTSTIVFTVSGSKGNVEFSEITVYYKQK